MFSEYPLILNTVWYCPLRTAGASALLDSKWIERTLAFLGILLMSLPDFQPQLSSQTEWFCSTTLIHTVGPTSLPKLLREESLKAQRHLSEFMATICL